jgi:hypothetical protein
MLPTYPAILSNDHLQWTGDTPPPLPEGVRVHVTLLDHPSILGPSQGARMAAALELAAAHGGLTAIADPVQWEREQREERALPGREA